MPKDQLAIHGGPKAKPTPYHRPSRYGREELELLERALDSGRLMGPGGMVREFEEAIEEAFKVKHATRPQSVTPDTILQHLNIVTQVS
jgi:dTDP-4-amino-4,6-dideoxygalactose transaminase